MFFGEYEHNLDEKNRFIMPSRFREVFKRSDAQRFYMTRGLDQCLALYMEADWADEIAKLKSKPYLKSDVRKFQRLLYSRTTEVVCDKQGRLLIPEKFKDSAGIEKDIVVVGMDNKIEIWDKQRWAQYNDDNDAAFEQLAEELFDLGKDNSAL